MRTIKFRVWDGDCKYMGSMELQHEKNTILLQSTNLLDSNGREIYEGDIVRSSSSREMFEVQWSDEGPGWAPFFDTRVYGGDGPQSGRDVVIVGNRYENPALLDAIEG